MGAELHEIDGIPSKRCPFCAELVPDTEKKCRYCKEYLDPSLRGKYTGGAAYWDGDYLHVPLGGFIRDTHCLVCGQSGGAKCVRRTFRYVPRWVCFLLVLLPLLYPIVIIMAIIHERQEIDVPVCLDCEGRWNQWRTMFRLYGVLALVALPIILGFIGNEVQRRDGGLYGVIAGLLVWGWGLFAIYALGLRRHAPTVRKIDHTSALLRLPNASLLQTAWEEQK